MTPDPKYSRKKLELLLEYDLELSSNLVQKSKKYLSRVQFTVKHSHKSFLTFMPDLGKSRPEITNFPFFFLSKMTINVRFFLKQFLGIFLQ